MPNAPLDLLDMAIRLALAALLGGIIGLDRHAKGKPAGFRTHALVALGAALVTVTIEIATVGDVRPGEPLSRVIQGILAGVGFLGGGAILKNRNAGESNSDLDAISGLTTAASIWIAASLGIACGCGYYAAAAMVVVLTLAVLLFGGQAEKLVRGTVKPVPEKRD